MPLDLLPHCAEANTENSGLPAEKKGNSEPWCTLYSASNQALIDILPDLLEEEGAGLGSAVTQAALGESHSPANQDT